MQTFYNKTSQNKIIFIAILLACFTSCQRPDSGYAPSEVIDAAELSSTENVIAGPYQISGTTEEIVEKKVSGSLTIEGVFNE